MKAWVLRRRVDIGFGGVDKMSGLWYSRGNGVLAVLSGFKKFSFFIFGFSEGNKYYFQIIGTNGPKKKNN